MIYLRAMAGIITASLLNFQPWFRSKEQAIGSQQEVRAPLRSNSTWNTRPIIDILVGPGMDLLRKEAKRVGFVRATTPTQ